MQEDFLHYIWQSQKFDGFDLKTDTGLPIKVISPGTLNRLAGPDFFNAQLYIGQQKWAGNVEMHLTGPDWFVHSHEKDPAYDNVILHVVWKDPIEVFRKDGTLIPSLVLSGKVDMETLSNYRKLLDKKGKLFINCEQGLAQIDGFKRDNWFNRMYWQRLERKSNEILDLLKESQNDWEHVLFCLLMKNFGLNINGPALFEVAKKLRFATIRKIRGEIKTLEALLMGSAGLLETKIDGTADIYHHQLLNEYRFLLSKFQMGDPTKPKLNFYGLRPENFPTIRLSQLAMLYHGKENLFSDILELENRKDYQRYFQAATSEYWEVHYVFGKESKKRIKKISLAMVDLILINTILPLKFCYQRFLGRPSTAGIEDLIREIPSEKNSIVSSFQKLLGPNLSAMDSQAQLDLYNVYCQKNLCLQCAIGNQIMGKK